MILFGDREAFLDKFRTCARARPLPKKNQILGEAFYKKENTKPLFKKLGFLTVQNLYSYHCFMEAFKILKFRSPIALHSMYNISNRKNTTLITPTPSHHFPYKSAIIWNAIQPKLQLGDYSANIGSIKAKLKKSLFVNQHQHSDTEWLSSYDFNIHKLTCS